MWCILTLAFVAMYVSYADSWQWYLQNSQKILDKSQWSVLLPLLISSSHLGMVILQYSVVLAVKFLNSIMYIYTWKEALCKVCKITIICTYGCWAASANLVFFVYAINLGVQWHLNFICPMNIVTFLYHHYWLSKDITHSDKITSWTFLIVGQVQ